MAGPRSAFDFIRPFVTGSLAAILLAFTAICQVVASPISVLDLDGNQLASVLRSAAALEDRDVTQKLRASPGGRSIVAGTNLDQLNTNAELAPVSRQVGASSSNLLDRPSTAASPRNGTLGEVLQSIVSWQSAGQDQRPSRASSRPRFNAARNDESPEDDEGLGVDLRKLILDSEVAGTMLRAIVDVKSADSHGSTFSIFGLGNFAIDVAPDLHAAIVSELSSGMAFRMSLSGERLGYDRYPEAALSGGALAGVPHENVNLIRVIWKWTLDMLFSPVGALLSMSATITVLLWVCVKSVVFLQRRASRF